MPSGQRSPSSPPPGPRPSRRFLVVATLFWVLFLITAENQLLIPLLPMVGRDLGASVAEMGRIFSFYALAAACFNLWVGPLTDRYGRLLFVRLGLLLFVLLCLGTQGVQSYGGLVALRSAMGVVGGLLSTATLSFVGDAFPYQNRGRVMGVVLSSYFAALVLGVPLGAALATARGWRTVFSFAALAGMAALGAALVFVRHERFVPSLGRRRYLVLLKRRDLLAAALVSSAVSGSTLAFLTYISAYLDHQFGLSALQISWVFLIGGLGAMLASPLSGWLADRSTKRGVFLVSNSALAILLLLLTRARWGFPLLALLAGVSLAVSFRQTSLQTLQTELVATAERGTYLALRNSFSQMGIFATVWVAGSLYSLWGYWAVTLLASGLTLAASALMQALVAEPKGEG